MLIHGAVLYFHHDHKNHHGDREQRIIVVRNGLDEKADAVFAFHETGYRCSPGGDRRDDTYRRCRRVDQISQLGA